MIWRNVLLVVTAICVHIMALYVIVTPGPLHAQDVPGIEICTVEKTMERRTSCLQSNVNFLQATIGKLGRDSQQKLDAANRQIEALKLTLAGLQKAVEELQAAQKQPAPAAKDAPAAALPATAAPTTAPAAK